MPSPIPEEESVGPTEENVNTLRAPGALVSARASERGARGARALGVFEMRGAGEGHLHRKGWEGLWIEAVVSRVDDAARRALPKSGGESGHASKKKKEKKKEGPAGAARLETDGVERDGAALLGDKRRRRCRRRAAAAALRRARRAVSNEALGGRALAAAVARDDAQRRRRPERRAPRAARRGGGSEREPWRCEFFVSDGFQEHGRPAVSTRPSRVCGFLIYS